MSEENNTQAAIDAGKALAEAQATVRYAGENGIPTLVINGEVIDLEKYLPAPVRRRANVTFEELKSFTDYVKEFKRPQSKIFANFGLRGGSFTAALDFHDKPEGKASFIEDKAVYSCPTTPEWNLWLEHDRKAFSQEAFAHFVEEQNIAFKNPSGATMLEIARTLEAKVDGSFKSDVNLSNGDRVLLYSEQTNATAGGKEKIVIPSKITVYLQPFFNGEYFQIEALLRYRINGGVVTFVYELQKPHEVVKTALEAIRNKITEETQIVPYIGKF